MTEEFTDEQLKNMFGEDAYVSDDQEKWHYGFMNVLPDEAINIPGLVGLVFENAMFADMYNQQQDIDHTRIDRVYVEWQERVG